MNDTHVIVIGAGLSGLSCARELATRGVRVTILEASERIGGRTLTDEDGTDLGGAYVGPSQRHTLRVIERYGCKVTPTPMVGKTCQLLRGSVSHYDGTIPPVSMLGSWEFNAALAKLEKLAATVDGLHPERTPNAAELDKMTCDEFARKLCPFSADARSMVGTAVRATLAVEPCEASVLGLLWYMTMNDGPKRVLETVDGLQDSRVVGGAGRLAHYIKDEIEKLGVKIVLNTPVKRVDLTTAGLVSIETLRGAIHRGTHVAVCIPPNQRVRVGFTPAQPLPVCEALKRWVPGHVIKAFAYYDTRFWLEKDLNGFMWCDDGVTICTFDDSKPDGSQPCIIAFILGQACTELYSATPEKRRELLTRHLAKVYKDDRALQATRYKEKVWVEEPYVGGCFVGLPSPGTLTQFPRELMRTSQDARVVFAGTEVAARSVGYMDGAIESGESAAVHLLRQFKRIADNEAEAILAPPPSTLLKERPLVTKPVERALPAIFPVLVFLFAITAAAAAVLLPVS